MFKIYFVGLISIGTLFGQESSKSVTVPLPLVKEEKKLPKIATESERCEFKSLQMESEYSILQNRLAQAERELGTLRATLAQLSNQKTAEDIRTKRANLCKDIAELNNCQIDEKTGEVTAIKPVEKK